MISLLQILLAIFSVSKFLENQSDVSPLWWGIFGAVVLHMFHPKHVMEEEENK